VGRGKVPERDPLNDEGSGGSSVLFTPKIGDTKEGTKVGVEQRKQHFGPCGAGRKNGLIPRSEKKSGGVKGSRR